MLASANSLSHNFYHSAKTVLFFSQLTLLLSSFSPFSFSVFSHPSKGFNITYIRACWNPGAKYFFHLQLPHLIANTVEILPGASFFTEYHFKALCGWQEEHNDTGGYSLTLYSCANQQLQFGVGTVLRVIGKELLLTQVLSVKAAGKFPLR